MSDEPIRYLLWRNPLSEERESGVIEAGLTVAELLDFLDFPREHWDRAEVQADGEPIDRESWEDWKPEPGQTISIHLEAELVATLLLIASFVAATVPGAATIGAIATGIALGGTLGPLTLGATLAVAGATIVGGVGIVVGAAYLAKLAVSSLVDTSAPSSGSVGKSQSPTASGSGNSITPYGPFWRVYGKQRVYPPKAGVTISRIINGERELRELYLIDGRCRITDLRLGETPIEDYGVDLTHDVQIREGTAGDPPIEIYAQEVGSDIILHTFKPFVYNHALPPGQSRIGESTEWVTRRAKGPANELGIEFNVPRGVIALEDGGRQRPFEFAIEIEHKKVSDSTWINTVRQPSFYARPSNHQGPGGVTFEGLLVGPSYIVFKGKSSDPYRRGFLWKVADAGDEDEYEVRIRRISRFANQFFASEPGTPENPERSDVFADLVWVQLDSIKYGAPVNTDVDVCTIAVRFQNDELGSAANLFNCLAESYLPSLDAGLNVLPAAISRNAAHVALDIALRGEEAVEGPTYLGIDKQAVYDWQEFCTTEGRTFDHVFDYDITKLQAWKAVASAARASWTMRENLISFAVEELTTEVVAFFSPRNSSNFLETAIWEDPPHAIVSRYNDEDHGYRETELITYDDGYSKDGSEPGTQTATRFENREAIGLTNRKLVYKDDRLLIATGRLRSRVYSLDCGLAGLRVKRGDLIRVAHDAILVGQKWGRFRRDSIVVDGGGNVTDVDLDEAVTMEFGKTYGCRVWVRVGSAYVDVVAPVLNPSGGPDITVTTLSFSTPIPSANAPTATEGEEEQFLFGESGLESALYIVTAKIMREDLRCSLEFVDQSPAIFDADTQPIPRFDPTLSKTIGAPDVRIPGVPAITDIASDESALEVGPESALRSRIKLTVVMYRTTDASQYTVQRLRFQARFRLVVMKNKDKNQGVELPFVGGWQTLPPADEGQGVVFVQPVIDGEVYEVAVRAVSADPSSPGVVGQWGPTYRVEVIGKGTLPPPISSLRREGNLMVWEYPQAPVDVVNGGGYKVRYRHHIFAIWGAGIEAHPGLIRDRAFDLRRIVQGGPGVTTVMVKPVDVAGNEALIPAVMRLNLGNELVDNVVERLPEHPEWAGILSGGMVDGGKLKANLLTELFWEDDGADFWTGTGGTIFWAERGVWVGEDGAPAWKGDDSSLAWGNTRPYEEMRYTVAVAAGVYPVDVKILPEVKAESGDWKLQYRTDLEPMWGGDDSAPFWSGTDSDPMWDPTLEFLDWPVVLKARRKPYDFRLVGRAGPIQSVISELSFSIDYPDIVEVIDDLAIPASGVIRVLLSKPFSVITAVNATLQQVSGQTAFLVRLTDKSVSLGPRLQAFDLNGLPAAATVDVTVQGY